MKHDVRCERLSRPELELEHVEARVLGQCRYLVLANRVSKAIWIEK
jgi:hypothetical protein